MIATITHSMSRAELIAECKRRGIKGYSGKRKAEIAAAIAAEIAAAIAAPAPAPLPRPAPAPGAKRVASIFSGCGGLDYGFHVNAAYVHVFAADFDRDACDSFARNFGHVPVCGDIKALGGADGPVGPAGAAMPDHDILIGGFPCQGFSMANPLRGADDARNALYVEILRLLKMKQPRYFMLENVKGLLNMGGYETPADAKQRTGKVMKVILADLAAAGYRVQFRLLDTSKFGVPQKRERVIFAGVRTDIDFAIVWPEPDPGPRRTLRDAIGDLPIAEGPGQHVGTKHKCAVTGFMGNRELKWDEPSPTITGRGGGSGGPVIHNHPSLERRLTVRECARIQTFPDTFILSGSISSMYRQIGNAVPCLFAARLAEIFAAAPV